MRNVVPMCLDSTSNRSSPSPPSPKDPSPTPPPRGEGLFSPPSLPGKGDGGLGGLSKLPAIRCPNMPRSTAHAHMTFPAAGWLVDSGDPFGESNRHAAPFHRLVRV